MIKNATGITTDLAKKEVDLRYRDHVNELVLSRFRIIMPICIFFHFIFYVVDQIAYPAYAPIFFQIRCVDTLLLILVYIFLWRKNAKDVAVGLLLVAGTIVVIGVSLMIFLGDGTSSRYYEGHNLVFLIIGMVNAYFLRYNIWAFLAWISIHEIAMLASGAPFNEVNFCFANYFMWTTAIFVIFMTKFYSEQHYLTYISQEQLKLNERNLETLYTEADQLSKTDVLTAIHNRRYFFEMLNKKIKICEASKTSFYLAIFDVDHFKKINDRYGHAFGDTVLIEVVNLFKKNIRVNDFIGRYGGDEFVVCIDSPSHEVVLNRLTNIKQEIGAFSFQCNNEQVPVSISIGVAQFKCGEGMTAEKLLESADTELFNVKKSGRGQISIL